jgi:hypothetical protein
LILAICKYFKIGIFVGAKESIILSRSDRAESRNLQKTKDLANLLILKKAMKTKDLEGTIRYSPNPLESMT